jgi:hypothetical protein
MHAVTVIEQLENVYAQFYPADIEDNLSNDYALH